MAHLAVQLTENIEIGAVRILGQEGLEVITTDGLREVRNLRTDAEPRRWEISIPVVDIDGDTTDYDAVQEMWFATDRGLSTFNFRDFIADEIVKVRFESPLQITAPAGHLRHIDTFTLKEAIGE